MITHEELLAGGAPPLDDGLKYTVFVDKWVEYPFQRNVRVYIVKAHLSFWQKLSVPGPLGVAMANLSEVVDLADPDALLENVVKLCHEAAEDYGVNRKYRAALNRLQS